VPGLTWPTLVFERHLALWMGKLRVELMQLGRGHTKGDTVVWLPQEKILFSGDLVEYDATPYTGDAYLADWPATLDAIGELRPHKLVPGRGASLRDDGRRQGGARWHARVRHPDVRRREARRARGKDLRSVYRETYELLKPTFGHWVIFDHCLPFDVSRA
jgi:glyoxylase-like metal-dependent hydrolase (beta-lactamase superfamily II)